MNIEAKKMCNEKTNWTSKEKERMGVGTTQGTNIDEYSNSNSSSIPMYCWKLNAKQFKI